MTLYVSEAFGPTFQGEGRNAGQRAHFLRLAGCNLTCSWCDAAYTWDFKRFPKDVQTWSTLDTLEWIADRAPARLVITGGEPLLQTKALTLILRELPEMMNVEVETNGTIPPTPELASYVDQWNVSPKLRNSDVPLARRWAESMRTWAQMPTADFKFVVDDITADIEEIDGMVQAAEIPPERVWLMPCTTSQDALSPRLARLAPAALARGYNLTSRLQIAIWGDRRGV